jgi:hypothetical protein
MKKPVNTGNSSFWKIFCYKSTVEVFSKIYKYVSVFIEIVQYLKKYEIQNYSNISNT